MSNEKVIVIILKKKIETEFRTETGLLLSNSCKSQHYLQEYSRITHKAPVPRSEFCSEFFYQDNYDDFFFRNT